MLSVSALQAQEPVDSLRIPFRKNYSTIDFNNRAIKQQLETFSKGIDSLFRIGQGKNIKSITIYSGTSPEGAYRKNKDLAARRAEEMVRYLKANTPASPDLFVVHSKGIEWDGLIEQVKSRRDMPYQQEMLEILENTPEYIFKDNILVDGRKRRTEMLHGGKPYWWMYNNLFQNIRYASARVHLNSSTCAPDKIQNKGTVPEEEDTECRTCVSEMTPPVFPEIEKPERKPLQFALKTNLLYDAATILNAGIEFYLGRNWTTSANWMYSWWKTDRKHWYWRTYGGELAVRKWLGRQAKERIFSGHHLGLYSQLFTYDFETGKKGQLSKFTYTIGLEYGYSLPITPRLNLDFATGLGYMSGEFKEYLPIDNCYVWQATKKRKMFGPTKAEVSLVWLFGKGNRNNK